MGSTTTAVLLAAGRGRRLGALTEDRPKCLAEVGGRTLLSWWFSHLHALGVQQVAVIGGYRAEQVFAEARAFAGVLRVQELISPRWASTNNLVSLAVAASEVEGPVLVVETDVLMERALVARTLEAHCAVVDVSREDQPGTCVAAREGVITRMQVGAHPWSEMLPWKTVNVTHLCAEGWRALGERLLALEEAGHLQDYWERALAELIEEEQIALGLLPAGDLFWREIDTEADLHEAQRALRALACASNHGLRRMETPYGRTKVDGSRASVGPMGS